VEAGGPHPEVGQDLRDDFGVLDGMWYHPCIHNGTLFVSGTHIILDFFRQSGIPVIAHPLTVVLPDPDDLPFLEVAASGHAIPATGNHPHFPKAATGIVRVLRVCERIAFRPKG